jgi:hypothetical protein
MFDLLPKNDVPVPKKNVLVPKKMYCAYSKKNLLVS